jgi:hypothetical protein
MGRELGINPHQGADRYFGEGKWTGNLFQSRVRDESDRMPAAHYGFTDEELDFIVNYDIKNRMGRNAESEDD